MSKTAIYLRRSTDRQEQSIDDQRRELVKFAERNGYEITREYVDDAVSGVTTEDRAAFLRMIDEAQTKPRPFDVILVYDVSRFGRVSQDEAGYYRHLLTKAGVSIVYAAEGFSGDESDELMRPMKQFMAHKMVRDLSKLTMRGGLSRAEKGYWCGGRPPYGYDVAYFDAQDREYQRVRVLDNGDREVRGPDGAVIRVVPRGAELGATSTDKSLLVPGDPARVDVVRKIYGWYAAGNCGYRAIAERLNSMGVHPPGPLRKDGVSSGWAVLTIREMLLNPVYRGAATWNRKTFGKFYRMTAKGSVARPAQQMAKRDLNPRQDWVVKENIHAPLVPAELWYAVQRTVSMRAGDNNEPARRSSRRDSNFLLSSLVTCGRCGHRYQGYTIGRGSNKRSRKDGAPRTLTHYYCCGGYVTKGNAVCRRTLLVKDEVEESLLSEVIKYVGEFVRDDGAALLEKLLAELAKPAVDRGALQARLNDAQKRLDDTIACLTPALASVLEPRIIGLQREVEAARGELEELERTAKNEHDVRADVAALIADLRRIESTIRELPFLERREVVRAITSGITFDPNTGDALVNFYAIPRVLGTNKERPGLAALASRRSIAGEAVEPCENYTPPRIATWVRAMRRSA